MAILLPVGWGQSDFLFYLLFAAQKVHKNWKELEIKTNSGNRCQVAEKLPVSCLTVLPVCGDFVPAKEALSNVRTAAQHQQHQQTTSTAIQ